MWPLNSSKWYQSRAVHCNSTSVKASYPSVKDSVCSNPEKGPWFSEMLLVKLVWITGVQKLWKSDHIFRSLHMGFLVSHVWDLHEQLGFFYLYVLSKWLRKGNTEWSPLLIVLVPSLCCCHTLYAEHWLSLISLLSRSRLRACLFKEWLTTRMAWW